MKGCYLFFIALASLYIFSCSTHEKKQSVNDPAVPENVAFPDTFYLGDRVVNVTRIDSVLFGQIPNEQYDTSEARNLPRDSATVKRNGDTLVMGFNSGAGFVSLVNYDSDTDEFNFAAYTYLYHDKAIGQYVIHGTLFEHECHVLIDDITGDTTYIGGLPIVNPDKKTFISCSHGVDGDGILCLFEWYENTHKPRLIGSKMIYETWSPESTKWASQTTLLGKGWTPGKANEGDKNTYYQFTFN